jgi:hypothetical protein
MGTQYTKFNYKILQIALLTVVIIVFIVFYYRHAQSKNKMDFLNDEKEILVKDLSF